MSDWAQAFANRAEMLDQPRAQSHTLVEAGEQAVEHWPPTHTMLAVGLIPTLKSWLSQLRSAMKPVSLWPVQVQRHGLKRYTGITWWHPNGLRLRVQIGRLWLLIQYERLCDWLHAVYRASVQWCIHHRRQLIWATIVLIVILAGYLWLRLALFVGGWLLDAVRKIWEGIFGP